MSALARLKALRAGSAVDFSGDSSKSEPSKPTKGGFDGFDGAIQVKTPDTLKTEQPAANQTPDHETLLDWHGERRAILQFDGGLSAYDAEAQARALTRARYDLPDDSAFTDACPSVWATVIRRPKVEKIRPGAR